MRRKGGHLIKLEDDGPSAPDIAGLGPAELEDHLRRPIMPRRDDAAVVLPVEGSRAKVDELDPGVPHPPKVPLRRRAVLGAPVGRDKQDVLRLQVGVGEVVVVQELDKKGKLGLLHRPLSTSTDGWLLVGMMDLDCHFTICFMNGWARTESSNLA